MSGQDPIKKEELIAAGVVVAMFGFVIYCGYKGLSFLFSIIMPDEKNTPKIIPFQMHRYHPFPKNSETYLVNTVEQCRYAMKVLKSHCNEYSVLGFDCEWVPCPSRRKVALLQLATHRGLCVLVRLSELKHIPSELKAILNDRSILKVGVASYNDAKYLFEDYFRDSAYNSWDHQRNHIRGTLDLRIMAKIAECDDTMGLERMCDEHLNFQMPRGSQFSDWETKNLSEAQILYATIDALASIELFKFFAEKIVPYSGYLYRAQRVDSICDAYVDVVFRGNKTYDGYTYT